MAITGNVNSNNSATGVAYTSGQLVLYTDVSAPPSYSTSSATIAITVDYTENESGSSYYWTINSLPKVTLSTKLPFAVYVCVKCNLASTDTSPSGGYITFVKTLSANTLYTNSMMTHSSNTSINPGYTAVPYNYRHITPNNVAAGISLSAITSTTAVSSAVSNSSLKKNIVFNITANTPTA